MRAFIGIALPDAVREALAVLQRELAQSGADVKWVERDNLHVTLKFLGEISAPQRGAIEALLLRVASEEGPFALSLAGVGAFPSMTAPRVLWVGAAEGRERVVRLAEAIEREGAAIPLPREDRPYAAHVTFGRVRSGRHLGELAQRLQQCAWQPQGPWRVTSVTLYQSILGSAGPRYTVLADVSLGSDP